MTIFTDNELERGEDLITSPFFRREIGQYHLQTVNFGASKKDRSIAVIAAWEGRDNHEVQHKVVVGDDAEQAELKSGLVADPSC